MLKVQQIQQQYVAQKRDILSPKEDSARVQSQQRIQQRSIPTSQRLLKLEALNNQGLTSSKATMPRFDFEFPISTKMILQDKKETGSSLNVLDGSEITGQKRLKEDDK